jgi:hypothetical protein
MLQIILSALILIVSLCLFFNASKNYKEAKKHYKELTGEDYKE